MGKIATKSYVNNNVRINAFNSSLNECVTKSDITTIEFLEAQDRIIASNITMTKGNYATTGFLSVDTNAGSGNGRCSIVGTSNAVVLRLGTPISTGSSGNISLEYESDSMNTSVGSEIINNAILVSTVTVDVGMVCTWQYQLDIEPCRNSSVISSPNTVATIPPYLVSELHYMVFVLDGDTNTLLTTPTNKRETGIGFYSGSVTFTTIGTTVKLAIIPMKYVCTCSNTNLNTATYYYGLSFRLENCVFSKQESYYDSTSKCVQEQDVKKKTGSTFTMYYGIWNAKSGTQAKLDYVSVQIKKTTDSSWTEIGVVNIGNVEKSGTLTGSVTCTIPATYDPSVLYDVQVFCGDTNSNQDWQAMWGNSANIKSLSGWSTATKTDRLALKNSSYFNGSGSTSTLNNFDYPSIGSHRGRSSTYAACFKIS